MKDHSHINRSAYSTELSANSVRIKELREAIERKVGQEAGNGRHPLSLPELALRLFARAPSRLLRNTPDDQLVEISEQAAQSLEEYLASDDELQITVNESEPAPALLIVLRDRPFIINTVNQTLRLAGVTADLHLHPILTFPDRVVSLSYLRLTEHLSGAQLKVLSQRLTDALSDLCIVTNDFAAMQSRVRAIADKLAAGDYPAPPSSTDSKEVARFLTWLANDAFIFLGYAVHSISTPNDPVLTLEEKLGLLGSNNSYVADLLDEIGDDSGHLFSDGELITVTKTRSESIVQRAAQITHVALLQAATPEEPARVYNILGMLTSLGASQECSTVPLVRRKIETVLELLDVIPNSHDHKNVISIIDGIPKDEVLRVDIETLAEITQTNIGILSRNETRVSIRLDSSRRGASVLILMPKERFNTQIRERIQRYVEAVFGAPIGSSEYRLDIGNRPDVKFYFYIPVTSAELPPIDSDRVEAEIVAMTQSWQDKLKEGVIGTFDNGEELYFKYADAFPDSYQTMHSVEEAVGDLKAIEELNDEHTLTTKIGHNFNSRSDTLQVIVYNLGYQITISQALPLLEHAGLEVIDENAFRIQARDATPVFVHRFLARSSTSSLSGADYSDSLLAPGLSQVFSDLAEDDSLNSLMLSAGLNLREIALLRTYCALLWQIARFASRGVILNTLADIPIAARQLFDLFSARFDPGEIDQEDREAKFQSIYSDIRDTLQTVSDITQDRVLRALASLVNYTTRTNYYLGTNAIALKINSDELDIMPHPRPRHEIFVRSRTMEGVHLRADRVARGGIRWSDRHQDYRNEILGLMKTQRVKNAVIVPQGAKGGFIVRNLPVDRPGIAKAVARAYQEFIRALLSITDNRIENKIVHPENVLVHDGEDPYLVVAADKGTATFSDLANAVAVNEYDFWLGDAFASGGSEGYDHKVFGITARGAWESVKRHFKNLGLDDSLPFSVVGIGDMSGDVFGNGMLLSDKIRLIGAFDHRHVFIDPDPDPALSFAERRRLFETPGSQWSDYAPELIGKGGGVFARFQKEIKLSPEIRQLLALPPDVPESVDGETLIKLLLQAPCDLLWNGGIGTYVKASFESNGDVEDPTNDRVRINADQLRARIVGEGGNLGFTQQARLEFVQQGGLMNTDAIDNSGGVDLSDHEVNIKILFSRLIKAGRVTMEERNRTLREIADSVVEQVLDHNRNQALLLTISEKRSQQHIEYFRTLLQEIVRAGYVNRALEFLPTDVDFQDRITASVGLWRPELAICLAAVKMWVKDTLLESDLLDEPLLQRYLLDYFVEPLRSQHRGEILVHPLARNIIATQATNCLVDSVGITFMHRMCRMHSVPPTIVLKCLLAAEAILDTEKVRTEIEPLDTLDNKDIYIQLRRDIGGALRNVASWLINQHRNSLSLAGLVDRYKEPYHNLLVHAEEALVSSERTVYEEKMVGFYELGIPESATRRLALFSDLLMHFEMLNVSIESRSEIGTVMQLFSLLIDELELQPILDARDTISTRSKWEAELVASTYQDIRHGFAKLTKDLLERNLGSLDNHRELLRSTTGTEQISKLVIEAVESGPSIAALALVGKQLVAVEI